MHHRSPRLLLSLLALLSALPVRLHSQDTQTQHNDSTKTYQIDEVVVTGTRTYRKIIDIPYSIERIDNTQFRFDRKTSVNDVLGSIPGLFFQNRYGNHDVRISIRGFGSRSNTGIRGVRILLDGIPESEPDGQTRIEAIDFQSIGRIEIAKGNSSSLYTNAPGGVINFINDVYFPESFFVNFNEFGSFDLRSNGFKTGVRTDDYRFLTTYNYHNAQGYRSHGEDFWHIVNSVLESKPSDFTTLSVYGNYVSGLIRLPGSLTKEQFDQDPFQANTRDVGRDARRISRKGRVGLRFESFFGEEHNHEVEVTGYGTTKYFERAARTYRVFNRDGVGGSGRYVNHSLLFGRMNEFSIGGDLFYQTGPISDFENIGGKKGDILEGLADETISNVGLYFQNSLNLIEQRMDLLLTGRFDKVVFDTRNQILEVQNSSRVFEAFTPKAALNYKLTPTIAAYTSYGVSFDSPAGNELDNYPTNSNPNLLLNPDLKPQESRNFELGIKGNVLRPKADMFTSLYFEVTFFNSRINDEIVPFEVFGDVFFRNSAQTNRSGLEFGGTLELVKGLRLKTAYTLSDFSYDSYTARTTEVDSLGDIVTIDRDFSGNIVPSVPEHNVSISLFYDHALTENITGFVKGTSQTISGMYTDDQNSDQTEGYHVLSSSAGLDFKFQGFNLLLLAGVNNITDHTYVGFININSAAGEFYEAGEPKNFFGGINLGYAF